MHMRYSDFLRWLLDYNRLDVVFEHESVFGNNPDHSNLWSDFETALGQYDFEKAVQWDIESLYISIEQVGNMVLSNGKPFFIDVSQNTIVDKSFTSWVKSIELAQKQRCM